MKNLVFTSLFIIGLCASAWGQQATYPITLVIHGGAGTITRQNMTPEKEAAYRKTLDEALEKGYAVLATGGTSLDAVEAAIRVMEDSPLFNAGKGAVFTHEGKNEMDAAVMNGANLAAGAIAGVTTIRNPIVAARAVMEQSSHVMLTGRGAEQFAREKGITIVPPSYFFTENRWKSLQQIRKEEGTQLDHKATPATKPATKKKAKKTAHNEVEGLFEGKKFGTVGCVALDQFGNLAAGTSTGGMTNKRWNRVGDAPIIGAGTYADNATCAVSATGHGEYFIRAVVGHDVAARMAYQGVSLKEAADAVVMKKLVTMGGEGGLIALDRQGNVAMPFNSEGMYRGYKNQQQKEILIYKD